MPVKIEYENSVQNLVDYKYCIISNNFQKWNVYICTCYVIAIIVYVEHAHIWPLPTLVICRTLRGLRIFFRPVRVVGDVWHLHEPLC